MKNVFKTLALLIVIFSFFSCEKESLAPNSTHINFENLAVGQKSLYVIWQSKNTRIDSDTTFKATTDTVSLSIVSEDARGFKVAEEYLNKRIATQYYYFQVKNDSLYVKPQFDSQTFINSNVLGVKQFTLKNTGLQKFETNRWGTPKGFEAKNQFGIVETLNIMGKTYTSALGYYDGRAIVYDGPYQVQIYSPKEGFISFQNLGSMFPGGTLYNLIP